MLDRIDLAILRALQSNGRISNVELAEKVGLSPTPCLRRLKRLEEKGIIRQYTCLLDQEAIGYPVNCFVSVSLHSKADTHIQAFQRAISRAPQVMECYLMTGSSDFLLRVVAKDLRDYERFLSDTLTRIEGVKEINTSFALSQMVRRSELPI